MFICWFAEQMIVGWLWNGFFTFSKSLFNSKSFDPHQSLQFISKRIIHNIKKTLNLVFFQEMDFQTLQTQKLSEMMCGAHYNTVHGAWHQHNNVSVDALCRHSYPTGF